MSDLIGVHCPVAVAEFLGPHVARLRRALEYDNGVAAPAPVLEFLAAVEATARARRVTRGPVRNQTERVGTIGTGDEGACAMVTVEVAASALGIGPRAVTKRITAGSLPARKLAGRWQIDEAELWRHTR